MEIDRGIHVDRLSSEDIPVRIDGGEKRDPWAERVGRAELVAGRLKLKTMRRLPRPNGQQLHRHARADPAAGQTLLVSGPFHFASNAAGSAVAAVAPAGEDRVDGNVVGHGKTTARRETGVVREPRPAHRLAGRLVQIRVAADAHIRVETGR